MNLVRRLLNWFKDIRDCANNIPVDPIHHCEIYRSHGCSHVDGFLCNVSTCDELHVFRKRHKLNCSNCIESLRALAEKEKNIILLELEIKRLNQIIARMCME